MVLMVMVGVVGVRIVRVVVVGVTVPPVTLGTVLLALFPAAAHAGPPAEQGRIAPFPPRGVLIPRGAERHESSLVIAPSASRVGSSP